MKKQTRKLMILVGASLMLTACGDKKGENEKKNEVKESNVQQEETNVVEEEKMTEHNPGVRGAVWKDDGTVIFEFNERLRMLKDGEVSYYCEKEDCRHSASDCVSYLGDLRNGTFALNNKMYEYKHDDQKHLIVGCIDSGEFKEVYKARSGEEIGVDPQWHCYETVEKSPSGEPLGRITTWKAIEPDADGKLYNRDGGQDEEVVEVENYIIDGYSGSVLAIDDTHVLLEMEDRTKIILDKEFNEIFRYVDFGYNTVAGIYNNNYYYINENNKLTKVDLKTKDSEELIDVGENMRFARVYEGNVYYADFNGNLNVYYVADKSTKNIKEGIGQFNIIDGKLVYSSSDNSNLIVADLEGNDIKTVSEKGQMYPEYMFLAGDRIYCFGSFMESVNKDFEDYTKYELKIEKTK